MESVVGLFEGLRKDVGVRDSSAGGEMRAAEAVHAFNRMEDYGGQKGIQRNENGRDDNLDEAVKVLNSMLKKGCIPNSSTFNTIFKCIQKLRDVNAAHRMYVKMKGYKCTPNTVTYNVLMRMFASAKSADMVLKLKKKMDENEVEPNVNTYQILITMYCGMGHWNNAYKRFKEMIEEKCLKPSMPLYEMVLEQLRKAEQLKKHEELVEKMVDRGFATRIRGIRNLIIYSLPERKEFYYEIVNMLEGLDDLACTVLFSQYDKLQELIHSWPLKTVQKQTSKWEARTDCHEAFMIEDC
ncbi:hypothetical protein GOBAR_DD05232 [Gossypium barbadense]|nr:hypothetical protein GOBAR_DD05232 [Gossypium barbadense]